MLKSFLPTCGLLLSTLVTYAQSTHPLMRLLPVDTIAYTLPLPEDEDALVPAYWRYMSGKQPRLVAFSHPHKALISFSVAQPAAISFTPVPDCDGGRPYLISWAEISPDSLLLLYLYGSCRGNCSQPVQLLTHGQSSVFPVKAPHLELGPDFCLNGRDTLRAHPFAHDFQGFSVEYPFAYLPMYPQEYPGIADSQRLSTLVLDLRNGNSSEILLPAPLAKRVDGQPFVYRGLYACPLSGQARLLGYANSARVSRWQGGQFTHHTLRSAAIDTLIMPEPHPDDPLYDLDRRENTTGWYESLTWDPWRKQAYRVVRLPAEPGTTSNFTQYSLIITDSSLRVIGEALIPYGYAPAPIPTPEGILLRHAPETRFAGKGHLARFRAEVTSVPARQGLSPAFQRQDAQAQLPSIDSLQRWAARLPALKASSMVVVMPVGATPAQMRKAETYFAKLSTSLAPDHEVRVVRGEGRLPFAVFVHEGVVKDRFTPIVPETDLLAREAWQWFRR